MKLKIKNYFNIRNIVILVISILFSMFMVIGISFDFYKSLKLVIKYPLFSILLLFILTLVFKMLIDYLFVKLDKFKDKDIKKKSKFKECFDNHPFLVSLGFILICWLIYDIAFYPGILTPDSGNQILQFFGIDNYYSHVSNLLDENMIITNHHPVVHTLLLGACVKVGTLVSNVNLGIFLYVLIQTLVLSSVLSYTISFMKNLGVSLKYRFICLIIYALVPVFPFYSVTVVKDVLFGAIFILYVIMMARIVVKKEKLSILSTLAFLIVMFLLILIRNNGFHIILLSFPFLLFVKYRDKFKLFMLFIIILGFNFSYNDIVLPYFKVTPSSVREKLSIPFQQTARYVKKYSDEVTLEEKEVIDKVLIYDTLSSRYDPLISDPVKNKFNKDSTDEDLSKYFGVWFNQFKKHPVVYLEATLHNTYGYYYPYKTNWYIYYKFKDKITEHGFDYHYNDLSGLRSGLTVSAQVFPYIPLVGLIVNIGFSTWMIMLMIGYLISNKKFTEVTIYIPSLVVLMVCIASPVNVYFRYALPNVFAGPLLIGLFISIIKSRSEKDER